MRRWTRITLFAIAAMIAAATSPANATAQPPGECAICTSCRNCTSSSAGRAYCGFQGGCCRTSTGSCGLAAALNVVPEDSRIIATVKGDMVAVRLSGDVFGIWACNDAGELSEAYREMAGGATVKLGPVEFAFYAYRYRFDEYIEVMNESILAPQA